MHIRVVRFFKIVSGVIPPNPLPGGGKPPPGPTPSTASGANPLHMQILATPLEASDIESDVIIQFLVGVLVIQFAGIFHVSCSVQKLFKNFILLQQLRNFINFWGQI
jgi:hypothetical protein